MAHEERTEQATPKRRQEAREKGQVAKSMELNAAIGLAAALGAIKGLGTSMVWQWEQIAKDYFRRMTTFEITIPSVQAEALHANIMFMKLALPLMLCVMAAGVLANVLQVGFLLSAKSAQFDFARLNPLEGIKRMFSQRAAAELLKSFCKALLVGYMVFSFFRGRGPEISRLILTDVTHLGPALFSMAFELMLKTGIVIVAIAIADYFFQRWQFEKTLRMTKQEVKEEFKRSEGDPLIKSRIRQRQREFARKRMMADVLKATVVITNPTHYAVALRYEPGEMSAPLVVAKGQRLVAQKIKELAKEHHIPVLENKPLAQALFAACEIGDSIPPDLYQAVAEIIAFVFKQSGRSAR